MDRRAGSAALAAALAAVVVAAAAAPTGTVLTPWGHARSSCVHEVPHGSHVTVQDDGTIVGTSPTGEVVLRKPSCQGGAFVDTAHRFEGRRHGARVRHATTGAGAALWDDDNKNDDGSGKGSGWQEYVKQNAGDVSSLLGKWTVPPKPSEEEQTLFLFTGLQNIDWVPPQPPTSKPFDIIQPVLQYGNSAAGDTGGWSIASWYVTLTGDTVYSTLKAVKSGDMLFGNMTRTGSQTWWINTVDQTSGTKSGFSVTRPLLQTQPWIYVTLEVYDVDTCAQYPPSGTKVEFTDLELQVSGKTTPAKWDVGTDGQTPPICGAKIEVESPSEVTITF